jgi:hypothetical protein
MGFERELPRLGRETPAHCRSGQENPVAGDFCPKCGGIAVFLKAAQCGLGLTAANSALSPQIISSDPNACPIWMI